MEKNMPCMLRYVRVVFYLADGLPMSMGEARVHVCPFMHTQAREEIPAATHATHVGRRVPRSTLKTPMLEPRRWTEGSRNT